MIFITGDVHCDYDVHKLNTHNWPKQKELTKNDYLIVCGDMGIVWSYPDGKRYNEDKYWQKWFSGRNFVTLFVDGNHENHEMLNNYEVEYWNGGKVHKIADDVYHLMRGQVYNIEGIKVFTMGGASSHDMHLRKEGRDWWKEELPSDAEYEEAISNLEKCNYAVDLIITHCAPDEVQRIIGYWMETDKLTNFLEVVVRQGVDFDKWYFGHYHVDRNLGKYRAIYDDIVEYVKGE